MEPVSTAAGYLAWRYALAAFTLIFSMIFGLLLLVVYLASGQAAAATMPTIDLPTVLDEKKVPLQLVPLFKSAAGTCSAVPATLLAAQAKQESKFQPGAVSPVGAQGIAQFMPATWAQWGVDANRDGRANPFDPADAIAAQARFMCHLAEQVRNIPGDPVDLMLAAYNAGLGRVQQYQGVPPFAETQGYVVAIRRYAAAFAKSDTTWVVPTKGRISSRPGPRWGRTHEGIDIAAPIGTPVFAATQGVVTAAGPAQGFGQWIKIEHYNTAETIYGHVSRIDVHVGQTVAPGQIIGAVGNEGRSTGPHLHFEVRANGAAADPIAYYARHGVRLG